MYVRWINRSRKNAVHLAAVLVENKWTDGRPIQHHIAYLGGITRTDAKDAERRVQFWAKVRAVLAGLGEQVSSEQRRKIEAALAARVPKPNEKAMRRHSRALRRDAESPSLPLGWADEQHDLEIEREEEEEREWA
jgi:hypothetical protein